MHPLQIIILAPHLISLSTTGTAPPTPPLTITTTIHNPSSNPITVLKWNTPLDPRAGVLGVFDIHDDLEDQSVPMDVVKFNRKLPPSEEDLVEIAPEGIVQVEVKLPPVKLRSGREYSVKASGRWLGLWEGGTADVALEGVDGGEKGEFESNVVRVKVE